MAVAVRPVPAAGAEPSLPVGIRPATQRPGVALTAALLAALAYAAFAGGAAGYPSEARVQVVLAMIAAVTAAGWLWHGSLRIGASPAAWAAVALLSAFAAWSGLSLAWSVDPSATWTELNRAIAYTLVVALALASGSWSRRTVARVAAGYLVIALAVSLYALGGKIAPGLHVDGVFDLNQTRSFARLRAPLEYWNALALFCVMAVPIALRLAVDETRVTRLRLLALAALPALLATVGLTYSRGGVLSLLIAVGVTIVLAGSRLRTLMLLALGALASAPALAYGFTADDLTGALVPLGDRQTEGLIFGALLLGGTVLLVVAGRLVLAAETRIPADAARSRRVGLGLCVLLLLGVLVGAGAMALSERGFTGTISDQYEDFTNPRPADTLQPSRLLTANSGNRWLWWEEAAGAWWDHPIEGSGAGSFPVLHRQYRQNELNVLQPHSVPLEFLAETGLVGALLALSGLALLLVAALAGVRRLDPGRERGLAAALAGAGTAWLVHTLYDWDWDMPGVTLPALLFLGVLAARAPAPDPVRAAGPGARLALLAAITLTLCCVVLSAAFPSWAESKSADARAGVTRNATPARLTDAAARVEEAARLDPLSIDPPLTAAVIADRRNRPDEALGHLIEAVRRQPENSRAWVRLAEGEYRRGDLVNFRFAIRRARELDPNSYYVPLLLVQELLQSVPPGLSATATGTPLVSVAGDDAPAD